MLRLGTSSYCQPDIWRVYIVHSETEDRKTIDPNRLEVGHTGYAYEEVK